VNRRPVTPRGIARRRTRGIGRVLAVFTAVCLALAGCTGVPRSSKPSAIAALSQSAPQGGQVSPPESGASQRAVLQAFLNANDVAFPTGNGIVQNFLVGAARSRWNPATVTVIDNENVGTPDRTNKIEVTGTLVGTIDKTGAYLPALTGDGSGSGGQAFTATYGLVGGGTVNGQDGGGQYRINSIAPNGLGLLLNVAQFSSAFRPYTLYFFDAAEIQPLGCEIVHKAIGGARISQYPPHFLLKRRRIR